MTALESHVEWTMPAPLWLMAGDPVQAQNRVRFRTPTILRFASDSFMDDFVNLLNTEPQRLNEFVVAPEAWNSPPNESAVSVQKSGLALKLFRARNAAIRRLETRGTRVIGQLPSSTSKKVLKLYQPAHQRFYLVTTCLVCRMLGLPDRRIDAGAQERATFVLRMLQPHPNADPLNPDPRDCNELALVQGAWQTASDVAGLVDGEEQHPLSPANYTEDDHRHRRLLIGLIPVGERERFLQMPQPTPTAQVQSQPVIDTRRMMLKTQVIGPMDSLEKLADASFKLATKPPSSGSAPTLQDKQNIVDQANDQIQQVSWYVLLDLAKYFETNLPALLDVILGKSNASDLPTALKAIWTKLSQTKFSGTTMADAIKQAYAASDQLENIKTKYSSGATGWPNVKFQFYKASLAGTQGLSPALDRGSFEDLIAQALPETSPGTPLPVRAVAQASANPQVNAWFTIRCVWERPNCGALTPPLLSEPTVAFQMAGYFDPDAPSRPIRIGLPVDTTPAGLRKFDKNTAFIMSDTLCGQVSKMSSTSFMDLILSVLPFPLHSGLSTGDDKPCAGGGMVCSFSIPIITICALILLIIFVKLLDMIFFWMPFFQICLPLPNFSAKD
jgi:hypothetical protein